MSDNQQLALDFIARLNAHDAAGAAAYLAEDAVNHFAIPEAQGRASLGGLLAKLWTAFPDMKHTVEDVIAVGDKVVVRSTVTSTHRGKLDMARLQLEPTGKQIRVEQIRIFRFANGKIAETWMQLDVHAQMRQLGLRAVPA